MQQLSLSHFRLRVRFILLASLAFVAAVVPAAAEGATMWLDPASLDMAPGDDTSVEIWIEDVTELAGAEIQLGFDPELLEIVDAGPSSAGVQIAHGDFLSPDFVVQNRADPKTGLIDYAIACIPLEKAVSGNGVLARITLRAVAEGKARIDVDRVLLANAHGESIGVEANPSLITVSGPGQRALAGMLVALVATATALGGCVVVGWRSIRAHKAVHRDAGIRVHTE